MVTREVRRASLWLELAAQCNLDCSFCYNHWRPKNAREFPEVIEFGELCENVSRLLDRINFEFVALSGGEPLLSPYLGDLTRWLSKRGKWTILTTNGRAFTRPRAAALCEAGLNGVQVPVLAADPELHDKLSGRASWKQAVTAVALGLEFRLATAVTFVLTKVNASQLSSVIELVAKIGAKRVIVSRLQLSGSAIPNGPELYLEDHEAAEVLATAQVMAQRENVQLVIVPDLTITPADGKPWRRLAISPDGQLKLCNLSSRTMGPLSSISDGELDTLARDMATGRISSYRNHIDTCSCFHRIAR